MSVPRPWRRPLLIVLVLYIGLAGVYSVVNPLFEAPDEVWHYGYVRWLARGNGLATLDKAGLAQWAQEGSQPPLYYLVAAAITAPIPTGNADAAIHYNPHTTVGDASSYGNRNMIAPNAMLAWPWREVALAAHVARLFSILLGAITVTFTFLIARLVAPGLAPTALLAASIVAFNPQFLFISASVTNDNIVTALCAAGLWLCLRLVTQRRRPPLWELIVLGSVIGLAALSKLSGLLLAGLAGVALTYTAWRAHSWRVWLRGLGVVFIVVLAVAGWWYWRNWQLFGDPLGLSTMFAVGPARDRTASGAELAALAPGVWRSFWAVFGWFNIVVDDWVYAGYTGLLLFGAAGWVIGWCVRRQEMRDAVDFGGTAILLFWITAVGIAVARWALINYAQGRLLFPALPAFASLLAIGLLAWWPSGPRRWATLAISAGMAIVAAIAPFIWIAPNYQPPQLLPAHARVPNPVDVQFGQHIRLVGYQLNTTSGQRGDIVDLTLYWQINSRLGTDYSVFVHATDQAGLLEAQQDSYPAEGSLPTSQWPVGVTIPDHHRFAVPLNVQAPTTLNLELGLYDFATKERLPVANGTDAYAVGTFDVEAEPVTGGAANPIAVDFDNKIRLAGFQFDRSELHPGDTLGVNLWWQRLAPMDHDYVAFAHLVLPPDAVWAQHDQMPQAGAMRTSLWADQQIVKDEYRLALPANAPPGVYQVEIGWYDKDTHNRLPVNFSEAGVNIGKVLVVAR